MRFERLELVRYGNFTDRTIDFPAADRDFHVIVGPNEAGKSTVRAAILDLLYGIPKNTPHAFLHAMSEMRLGASMTQGSDRLQLQRVKGNRQTLRDLADKPLADGAMATYLGSTDRDFFTQMFGLDHERLVRGGLSILSASNDLGQILFQSAAGIAGLGAVRDNLEAQADGLWSKRRSGERKYYIALDEFDSAAAALKQATVRTKDWSGARARVAEIDGAHAQVRDQHAGLRKRRNLLDRVRRVASHVNALDEAALRLAALGDVVELPEGAGRTLADAERALAVAQFDIDHQTDRIAQAQTALEALVVDVKVQTAGAEINALNEQRVQYRAYTSDIARRQSEIDTQWVLASGLAAELGWDNSSEETVSARLPLAGVRLSLGVLLHNHAAIHQVLDASERAAKAKQAEVDQARAELAGLPGFEIPLGLQVALANAQKLGDYEVSLDELRKALQRQESVAEAALAALGKWRQDADTLRRMTVPSADVIQSLAQQQINDDAQARELSRRIAALQQQTQQARLDVAQYQRAHDTVTRDAVVEARRVRDATWEAVKANAEALVRRGSEFELQLSVADALADRRHDTIQEASELQGKLSLSERAELELSLAFKELKTLRDSAETRVRRWSTIATASGLSGLMFEAAAPWLDARVAALAAVSLLDEARRALQAVEDAISQVLVALACELDKLGVPVSGLPLKVLTLAAERHLQTAAGVGGQRRTLDKQASDGERDMSPLLAAASRGKEAANRWADQWAQRLAGAGLDRSADVTTMEGILDTAEKIDAALALMRKTRTDRIDKMRADLEHFGMAAQALALRLAPELAQLPGADISLGLASRLASANETHKEAERQYAAMHAARGKLGDATLKRGQAQATVAPLLQRAGIEGIDGLAGAIERSDQRRALMASSAAAERAIREAGDGLNLEQLRSELALVNLSNVQAELSDLVTQEEGLVDRLASLSAQGQAAATELQAIGGTADAARAEARRQEALAAMSDVVERYVKVFTAARLLRWSIEHYREAKQGPMLSAASVIFSRLTLGSFEKLTVDFESEPPKLLGRRPNGAMVAIEGMSEGTRDQLYLALRLAALHMHLGHAQVLPFIADDLFINYDDVRSKGGLEALGELSRKTQVLFLTHHDHLLPSVREVFGATVNVVRL